MPGMVAVRRPGIGADFRVERRLAPGDPAAEPRHHRGDDMIGADAQPLAGDLQRQMPVAEMPGDAQQARGLSAVDLDDRLGGGAHPDIAAVVELEPVAFGQMLGARQIEQKRRARIGDQPDAAAMPVEIGQRHRVDRRLVRPMAARMDRNRPPHLVTVIARSH